VTIDPELVRQARLKAGLSLAQVAGSELTRQAVHLIETGKVRPSARSLQVIARRLEVPAQSFCVSGDLELDLPYRRAAELERLCDRLRYDEVVELAGQLLATGETGQLAAVGHLYLGRGLAHLARAREALKHLRRARRLFIAEEDPWSAAEAREWEAAALYLQSDPRAVAVGEEALRQYRALEPHRADIEARMLEHVATFLVRQQDFLRAQRYYLEALQVAGPLLDLARLGRIYHGLSRCHVSLGDVRRAIELATRAVALYEVENDLRPVPARIDLPRVENDLGMMLVRDGQLGRAEELFQSALGHLNDAGGVERLTSYVLLSLAEVRQAQDRLDDAQELIERAMERAQGPGERIVLADAYRQLGELHAERDEHDLADRSFDAALAILTEAGMVERKAECLAAYHRVLEARGELARLERSAG
jgi:tetratricopeptide (TPR) repeat protein